MNPSKEYKISTLEKSFIWQPNFGLDMGINLDLVDQESILVQEIPGIRYFYILYVCMYVCMLIH